MTPIMESCPISIPNARQCRVNHGLPSGDITFGAWKVRVKSLERQRKSDFGRMDFRKTDIFRKKNFGSNNFFVPFY